MSERLKATKGTFRLACLLAGLWLVCSCKTYSSRQLTEPAPAIARLKAGGALKPEVDRLVEPLIRSKEACGMAVGVLTPDGQVRSFGYGSTGAPGEARPPDLNTIFQVGSISKVFLAAVLAVLVDEGQMHYEDNVRSILPPEIEVSAEVGELTVLELLTHTGGLPRQPNNKIQLEHFLNYLFTGQNLYGYITRPYFYDYLRNCPLTPKAKRRFVYSNIGTALLAQLMEIRTGRTFPDLVEEKICRPLNLCDTTFSLNEEQLGRLAVGHVGDQPRFLARNTPMTPWDMGEVMRASGGLYSTVHDLMIFSESQLGLLRHPLDRLLASTHQVQTHGVAEDVALGWLVKSFDQYDCSLIYMHGMVSGYSAYVCLGPDRPLAVIVLCNNFNWQDKVGQNLGLRLAGAFGPGSNWRDHPTETVNSFNTSGSP